jgi:small-conductance mechanosensitive channel
MNLIDAVSEAFTTALAGVFAAVPAIAGALLILIIGWIVAGLVGRLLARLLRIVRFNDLAAQAELNTFVERAGSSLDPAEVLAALVKWFVRIIFIVAAANTLNMPQVSEFLNEVLTFLPNVAVAVIILVLGALLARVLRDLTRGATSTASDEAGTVGAASAVVYWAIIAVTVITALEQLGVATSLSETLYLAVFGAIGLTVALAAGLGARNFVADLLAGLTLARQLKVGDTISVGQVQGTIQHIGGTMTVMEYEQGSVVIPNSTLASEIITR